jgi:integrase
MSKRSGQSGSVRLQGNKWYGRYWRDVPGKSKREHPSVVLGTKGKMTKPQARRRLMEIVEAEGVNTPEHLERALKPVVTFNNLADAWEQKRIPQLKPSTQYTAPCLNAKHLRPFFGQMTPEEIKTGVIDDWLRQLTAKGLEPKTVHNLWKIFRAIMNWHAQQNDEPKRAWYPTLPTIPEEEQRWFTQDEARRIISAAPGQYKALFHLAATSGLRSGELAGLHYEDVDFVRGVIRVRRSVWKGQEVSTKTKRGFRDVWVDSTTIAMLRQHLGTRTSGRLFQSRLGTPLENRDICRRVLTPICERLGIAPGGMHAFRHGRVSHLQTSGVPADFTKNQIGHSSLRTTSGYTHFTDAFKRETVERLATEMAFCTQNQQVVLN